MASSVPAAIAGTIIYGPGSAGDAQALGEQAALVGTLSLFGGALFLVALVGGLLGALGFSISRTELGPAHGSAIGQARLFFWLGILAFPAVAVGSFFYGLTVGASFQAPPTARELNEVLAGFFGPLAWSNVAIAAIWGLYFERVLSGILGKSQMALRIAFLGSSIGGAAALTVLALPVMQNPAFLDNPTIFSVASSALDLVAWSTLPSMACYLLLLRAADKVAREAVQETAPAAPALGVIPGAAPAPPGFVPGQDAAEGPLLAIRGLTVRFYTYDGVLKALDGVNFSVGTREIFGVVGETGCGKSVMAKSILRLIPDPPGRITGGEVVFEGINLLDSIEREATIVVNERGRAKIHRNRKIAKRMEAIMRTIRGNVISMIFQEPSAALNPVLTVRKQIGESFVTHQLEDICDHVESQVQLGYLQHIFFNRLRERGRLRNELEGRFRELTMYRWALARANAAQDVQEATRLRDEVAHLDQVVFGLSFHLGLAEQFIRLWQGIPIYGKRVLMKPIEEEVSKRVVRMLQSVRIPDPEKKADNFPFELSGGMQQRVMIAMALSCRPRLLIADEPTTALDVTIQAQILSLIRDLRDKFGSSVILITHDLGVVAETCDRVGVMYAGVMAEVGVASDIFTQPKHPYTVGLLRSIPETYARTGSLAIIPGSVPSLLSPPDGCRFHPRCPFASEICRTFVPPLIEVAPGHAVACHLYDRPESFPPETIAERDAGLNKGWTEVRAL